MNSISKPVFLSSFFLVFAFSIAPGAILAQKKMDRIERETMAMILKNVKNEIKKDYYDPGFRGIDIDARFTKAEARLGEVGTTGEALAVIAQVMMDFNDSHLYFIPPSTNLRVEYGWRHRMFGDKLLVTIVKPKSDAEAKGLKTGDEIVSIEGFRPTRKELWKVMYYYNILSKRQSIRLGVVSPGESGAREIVIESKIRSLPKAYTDQSIFQLFDTSGKSILDYNYFAKVGGAMIWKMPTFSLSPDNVDTLYAKVKDSPALILDLRGNGGGAVIALERLVGLIFGKEMTIATLKGRKPMDPIRSKLKGEAFNGKLAVLIDSGSGSASEIFARLIQLEKRGQVVGDVSAGAVLQAKQSTLFLGAGDEIIYGVSVTNADVIMSDGKSLENSAVHPDVLINPSAADLAAGADPVLAEALRMLGNPISPADAGKLFRLRWTENPRGDDLIEIVTK